MQDLDGMGMYIFEHGQEVDSGGAKWYSCSLRTSSQLLLDECIYISSSCGKVSVSGNVKENAYVNTKT